MFELWVFNILCVLSLKIMSSLLYCVFYVAKEVCVFFMFPNLSLFFKWSSFILGMDESMFNRGYLSLLIKVMLCELLIQLCY
jgi:hypothetical protein